MMAQLKGGSAVYLVALNAVGFIFFLVIFDHKIPRKFFQLKKIFQSKCYWIGNRTDVNKE